MNHHPDLLIALEPQASPFSGYTPANWPTTPQARAIERWSRLQLPI